LKNSVRFILPDNNWMKKSPGSMWLLSGVLIAGMVPSFFNSAKKKLAINKKEMLNSSV
jgi:hypothetical protein